MCQQCTTAAQYERSQPPPEGAEGLSCDENGDVFSGPEAVAAAQKFKAQLQTGSDRALEA